MVRPMTAVSLASKPVHRNLWASQMGAVARASTRIDREVVGFDGVRTEQVIKQVLASWKVIAGQHGRGECSKQHDVVHCRHRVPGSV